MRWQPVPVTDGPVIKKKNLTMYASFVAGSWRKRWYVHSMMSCWKLNNTVNLLM